LPRANKHPSFKKERLLGLHSPARRDGARSARFLTRCGVQVRYLTRVVTPEEYDEAVRRVPEMCPMYYMGDRRTGRQLLDDFDADAASPSPCATAAPVPSSPVLDRDGGSGMDLLYPVASRRLPTMPTIARRGRLGRLDRIAAVVSRLVAHLAAPPAVTWDTWVHGVRGCVAAMTLRCARRLRLSWSWGGVALCPLSSALLHDCLDAGLSRPTSANS
jgi:hypothetical protein